MRYPAAEKLEIIRLVEGSHLSVRRSLEQLGIPRATFYRWYELYQEGGPEALEDRASRPERVWNRIPDAVRSRIVDLALEAPELSPRELAVRFTDQERYFVSEASVYRLLKAHDLIPSPAFIVVKVADEFHTKTTARPCCIDQSVGCVSPRSPDGQVVRTYSGRPRSNMRFSTSAAIVTSVSWRPAVCERKLSPMTRFQRDTSASTRARQL